jgi:hypothetical protein
MSSGKRFLQKCLDSEVVLDPWPYQLIDETFSEDVFLKLKNECKEHLKIKTDKLIHIHPNEFKEHGINFYDETVDICSNLFDNVKQLHEVYPEYRKYPTLGINAHISITPPLPYKFYIHQEGLEKTWSAVTYITPKNNVGTKMYTAQDENAFVKEVEWKPNSTFIFCGQQNKTWHSYESNQDTNRITFNLFVMKHRSKKCFYPL